MKVVYKNNYVKKEARITDRVNFVERSGYASTKQRVDAFRLAGLRLKAARDEQYDCIGDIDLNYWDKTRDPNFDIVDVFREAEEINARILEKVENEEKVKIKDIVKNKDVKPDMEPLEQSEA